MTQPQPQPAEDKGHILSPEKWAAVEAERAARMAKRAQQ